MCTGLALSNQVIQPRIASQNHGLNPTGSQRGRLCERRSSSSCSCPWCAPGVKFQEARVRGVSV